MNEREHLAAEYALGLLEGAELLEARNLAATNDEFARHVDGWAERFAPLFEEYGEVEPPAAIRERILRALESDAGAEVVALRRRLGRWKAAAAAASAVAASLLLVVAYEETREAPPSPTVAAPSPTLVASVRSDDLGMLLSAAWQDDRNSLTVTPGAVTAPSGRSHELWIIPAGGAPSSLGVIADAVPRRITVSDEIAAQFADGATLAISVEPDGGSLTGSPTGPVIASGTLSTI